MPDESPLSAAVRMTAQMEAVAALAAHIRVRTEGIDVDPRISTLLDEIVVEICGQESNIGEAATPIVGMVRALLRQSGELVDNPARIGDWDQLDEGILQGLGRMSMTIVDAFRAAAAALDGLGQRLQSGGARFLDVGTGTGWLAIATAMTFPTLEVTGIDVWEPALELARKNVTASGLDDRIRLALQDAVDLPDGPQYDAIWLPLPFMPKDVVPRAVAAAASALRPGGWLLAGAFAGPDDRLSQLLVDLRTVRSGGHPWTPNEMLAVLDATPSLRQPTHVPRTWKAPVALYAAQRES